MKYTISFIILSFIMSSAWSQNNNPACELNFFELFVVKIEIRKKVLTGKDYCVYKERTKCGLYEIEVKEVLYSPVNAVYDSSPMLPVMFR